MTMKRRENQYKIPDIKVILSLTRLLGAFQIPSCYRYGPQQVGNYDVNGKYIGIKIVASPIYGWGLKECKDYVESKYDYYLPGQETKADRLRGANIIHETKRVRQVMNMLNKLGIKSADSGLVVCKAYVTRQRN